jgi:hypothetical protein
MIPSTFRTYVVEANDFPITLTVSTGNNALPRLPGKITVQYQVRATAKTGTRTVNAVPDNAAKTVSYSIPRPAAFKSGIILFSLLAGFPVNNPSPYKVNFLSADDQKALDVINPDSVTPVFANYALDLK